MIYSTVARSRTIAAVDLLFSRRRNAQSVDDETVTANKPRVSEACLRPQLVERASTFVTDTK